MGNSQELELRRIFELAEAVSLVGDNSLLDAKIVYRLGRLGDYCKSPVRVGQKEQEKKRRLIVEQQREIQAKNSSATEEERKKNQTEIAKLNEKFSDEIDALFEQKETISVPEFKLSDFMAKEEKKVVRKIGKGEDQRDVEIVIKPGEILVPVRFFTLMGEFVIDDKDAMK